MTIVVASIVEGHGEQAALPVLLRRIFTWLVPHHYVHVSAPIRVHRDRFLNRQDEFSKYLRLASLNCGDCGWVMIVLDADDDCPMDLGGDILKRAEECLPGRLISVILANREYEAWFVAAASSLDGIRGFKFIEEHPDPEGPRDAKGWISLRMGARGYGEVLDQAALSEKLDIQSAHDRSRSFRKLVSECKSKLKELLEG